MEIEGDDQAAVRLAFDLSYSTLKPTLSRFFRMLSLIPGTGLRRARRRCRQDASQAQAQRMLGRAGLGQPARRKRPGRYGFHDLIKEFALERVQDQETEEQRQRARERLFGFYLRWANSASLVVYSESHPVSLPDVASSEPDPEWTNADTAMAWLEREAENLVAMTCARPTHGLPVWTLADTIATYLNRSRYDSIWKSAFTSALTAAQQFGSAEAQASAHRALGRLTTQHPSTRPPRHTSPRPSSCTSRPATRSTRRARSTACSPSWCETGRLDSRTRRATHTASRVAGIDIDQDGRVSYLFNLGMLQAHFWPCRRQAARLAFRAGASLTTSTPRPGLRCWACATSGAGDLGAALRNFHQALSAWQQRDTTRWLEVLRNIANTALVAGFPDLAKELAEHAMEPRAR